MPNHKRNSMNKLTIILILFLAYNCNAQEKRNHRKWNLAKERTHNENRNDSTKWSKKLWANDTQEIASNAKPMTQGVYPVPDYDLADSTFNGLGYSGDWKGYDVKDKKIVYHYFYINKNNINKEHIADKPNEVFFAIAVLTDSVDTKRYTHTNVWLTSRNHPHYIGQGYVKTKTNKIEFMSFITADRQNYAIVNMRLFDLRIGRLVLIAPKKDGTLRSLQLNAPIMSSGEMKKHIKHLLKNDKQVIDHFTKPDNI